MNTMELFKEANNGVVLKTSQKVSFDDIFLVHISGKKKKKNFLVVVVHTWNKTWRQRKEEEELRTRSFFPLPTPGVLGRMCCEHYEMCGEYFRICSQFKICFEEFGMCCA